MLDLLPGFGDFWLSIRLFIDTGGWVLWGILAVSVLLWSLILSRYWYVFVVYPGLARQLKQRWAQRADRQSWYALRIRELWVSDAREQLLRSVPLIKLLVAVAPLFGLLGTVTGMIQVFDVMAVQGTGDAQAMAAGVSRATVPTMAGMVVALSGLFFGTRLEWWARHKARRLEDALQIDHAAARARPV